MIEGKNLENKGILTYGQVGGGEGSFIGPVHRAAISITGQAKIVSGSFSRSYKTTLNTAKKLGIPEERTYKDFEEMAQKESKREDKPDFILITTPNHLHYKVAKTFLENDFNIVCDKPLCFTIDEAKELVNLTREKNVEFMVTYTYTGYPMVREAKKIISSGKIGKIRIIMAEYPQDWLADPIEKEGHKQAEWRTDPKYAGISCCVADIGTHVENLVHFITGLEIKKLAAHLQTFVKDRSLDDNAYILLKYDEGASGNYWTSQVAVGEANGLKIRIYGTEGAIEWKQENPDILKLSQKNNPIQYLIKGREYLSESAQSATKLPAGHPEGYLEAFSNLYKFYINTLLAKKIGETPKSEWIFTDVIDGARGIKFVHDCVESSKKDSIWIDGSFKI